MEDIVAQKSKYNTSYAHRHKQYFADKDESTLSRLVYWVYVISSIIMIFETEPAELMPTWTGHVWTSCSLFNWNLTFWAFVRQKQEIYKSKNSL